MNNMNASASQQKTKEVKKWLLSEGEVSVSTKNVNLVHLGHEQATNSTPHLKTKRKLLLVDDEVSIYTQEANQMHHHSEYTHSTLPECRTSRIVDRVEELTTKTKQQHTKLNNILILHKFLSDFHDAVSWINTVKMAILKEKLPEDPEDAEALIERHEKYKEEVDTFASDFDSLYESGKQFLLEEYETYRIQEKLFQFTSARSSLQSLWEQRHTFYKQYQDLQLLLKDIDSANKWILKQENCLSVYNRNLINCKESLDDLIKEYENFKVSVESYSIIFLTIEATALKLINKKHYAATDVSKWSTQLRNRYTSLQEKCFLQKIALKEAYKLNEYEQQWTEINKNVFQKFKFASNTSFLDVTTLILKIIEYRNFKQIFTTSINHDFIDIKHYAMSCIQQEIKKVQQLLLKTHIQIPGTSSSLKLQYFSNQQDHGFDFKLWLSKTKNQAKSKEHSQNVIHLHTLQEKIAALKIGIDSHLLHIGNVKATVQLLSRPDKCDITISKEINRGSMLCNSRILTNVPEKTKIEFLISEEYNKVNDNEKINIINVAKDIVHQMQLVTEEAYKDLLSTQKVNKLSQIPNTQTNSNNMPKPPAQNSSNRCRERVSMQIDNSAREWHEMLIQEAKGKSTGPEPIDKECAYFWGIEIVNYWLNEIKSMFSDKDVEKSLFSIYNFNMYRRLHTEVQSLGRCIDEMNHHITLLAETNLVEIATLQEKQELIKVYYATIKDALPENRFTEADAVNQFIKDVNVETKRITEEKLQVDMGHEHNLLGIQNRQTEYDNLKMLISSHESVILNFQERGKKIVDISSSYTEEVDNCLKNLNQAWFELKKLLEEKKQLIDAFFIYHKFETMVQNAKRRINEGQYLLNVDDCSNRRDTAYLERSTLKTDVQALQDYCKEIQELGEKLIKDKNSFVDNVLVHLIELRGKLTVFLEDIEKKYEQCKWV